MDTPAPPWYPARILRALQSKRMLSPRRVKPAPVVVMYELRSLRAAKPLAAMRTVEARIKKWRGLVRWTMMAFT